MNNSVNVQTITLDGKRYVILSLADYHRMIGQMPTDKSSAKSAPAKPVRQKTKKAKQTSRLTAKRLKGNNSTSKSHKTSEDGPTDTTKLRYEMEKQYPPNIGDTITVGALAKAAGSEKIYRNMARHAHQKHIIVSGLVLPKTRDDGQTALAIRALNSGTTVKMLVPREELRRKRY